MEEGAPRTVSDALADAVGEIEVVERQGSTSRGGETARADSVVRAGSIARAGSLTNVVDRRGTLTHKASIVDDFARVGSLIAPALTTTNSVLYNNQPNLANDEHVGDRGGDAADQAPAAGEEPKKKPSILEAFSFAERFDWMILAIGTLVYIALGVLQPLMNVVFSSGIANAGVGNYGQLKHACGQIAIIGACGFVGMFIATWCYEYAAERQIARIKRLYVANAVRLNVGYFDTIDIGTLASDVEASCVQIRAGIGNTTGELFKNGSLIVSGYAFALVYNWKVTLIMTCAVPVMAGSMAVMMKLIGKVAEAAKTAYTKAGSVADEAIPAIRTIASFGLEDLFSDLFNQRLAESVRLDLQAAWVRGAAIGFLMIVIYSVFGTGWLYGGKTIHDAVRKHGIDGVLETKNVMTAFFCVVNSAFTLGFMGPPLSSLATASRAVVSVKDVITKESAIDPLSEEGLKPEVNVTGKIEFDRVRFAYPSRPERDIYQSVSFTIQPGDTVALVGPSGCGKSTVIQLIERFYDATGGTILIDDRPIVEYNLAWLRRQMALVSQEPRLFCDTIKANILQGRPGATDEEVIAAAKAANAHDFITALANQYETSVGIGGGLLSGGQKQRIAIARAILRDPAIMILDEATSALDNRSEKVVQEALDKLLESKKRTTIIIAHRLTTIRNANKIIVIDNVQGKGSVVIEQGTHDQLMEIEKGVYKQLVEAQQVKGNIEKPASSVEAPMLDMGPGVMRSVSKQLSKRRSSQLDPGESKTKGVSAPTTKATKKLWMEMLKTGWPGFIAMMLGATCTGAMQPTNGLLVSTLLNSFFNWDAGRTDRGNAERIFDAAKRMALTYLAVGGVLAVAQLVEHLFSGRNGTHTIASIRRRVFANILHQDMEFFDNPAYNTGFLSSVLSADCELAKTITGINFTMTYRTIISLVIGIAIALTANWKIALMVGGMWVIIIPLYIMQIQYTESTSIQIGKPEDVDSPAFVFNEMTTNIRNVAAYNLQPQIVDQYRVATQKYLNIGLRNAYVTAGGCAVSESMSYFASAAAYRFGAYLLSKGEVSYSMMTRATMAIMFAGNGAGRTAGFTAEAKRARVACQNVYTVLERRPKMDARSPLGELTDLDQDISVNHVKFRYPGRPTVPVLRDVSFKIPRGKTVALVGESGSGKSTIIQFLERFYDVGASDYFVDVVEVHNEEAVAKSRETHGEPALFDDPRSMYAGSVTVGAADVQHINLRHLRAAIGLVSQEPVLFDRSVAENIRYGKLDATQAEIEQAARLANAHEFIAKLPEGYETKVGRGGGLLSGGQKQRVAIARALVRNPKVLLLDEATSALDPESEVIVQAALDKLLETSQRTTLVIAHRLSTIRNADLIVVFQPSQSGSHIAEAGTHDELMQRPNGVYQALVRIAEQAQK